MRQWRHMTSAGLYTKSLRKVHGRYVYLRLAIFHGIREYTRIGLYLLNQDKSPGLLVPGLE